MAGAKSTSFWNSLAQLWRLIDRRERRQLWIVIALTVVSAFAEVVTIGAVIPFLSLLGTVSDPDLDWLQPLFRAAGATSRHDELATATLLLAAAAIAAGVLRLLVVRKTQDFAAAFGHQLSVEVQRRMLLQPYAWHARHNSSEQLATIEKAEIVTDIVLLPLVHAIAAVILTVVILAVLLQIAPLATIVAGLALGGAYYALGALARARLDSYSATIGSAFGRRIRILQEGLGGIRDLILDGSQERVVDQFRAADWQLARARADATFVSAVPRFLIEPAGIIVIAALALVLSQREGGLVAALPILGALALGAQRLLPLVQQLYRGWSNVAVNKAILDELAKRLSLPVSAAAGPSTRLPFTDGIEFRDVSYSYADRAEPAVEGLSFAIPRGSRVALVGPTGSGKTTTADLLMGLLHPAAGSILVDGKPLTDEKLQSWRANIAHVPQMLFVADATVAENIALGAEIDPERVREAGTMASLDDFVSSSPKGYQTRVGERGAQISGGQRQRLAIARAIYKDAPLLVFDEATSALDEVTEQAVLAALDQLQAKGTTIIIIAHRESTTERCDQVLRLENGRLVEDSSGAG